MKKAILINLEEEQIARLDEEKRKTGSSRAEIIRQATRWYFDTYRRGRRHGRQRHTTD